MPDYFLWLEDNEAPIRRLVVDDGVANRLEPIFASGARDLLSVQELVPLENEPFQPDETEAWLIENFQLPAEIVEAAGNPIGVPQAGRDLEESRVRCLIASGLGDVGGEVAFQVVDRRQVLTRKALAIILAGDTYRRLEEPGLLVGDAVHVVHSQDRLIFQSLWWARRVFSLEEHYVEATQEQIDAFVDRQDVELESEGTLEQTSQWERKRISYLVQSGLLDQTSPVQVRDAAREYGVEVGVMQEGGVERLIVPDDRGARRQLLKFLEEDYYAGPLTEQKYVANSKRRFKP